MFTEGGEASSPSQVVSKSSVSALNSRLLRLYASGPSAALQCVLNACHLMDPHLTAVLVYIVYTAGSGDIQIPAVAASVVHTCALSAVMPVIFPAARSLTSSWSLILRRPKDRPGIVESPWTRLLARGFGSVF